MFFRIFMILPLAELVVFALVAEAIGWGNALLWCFFAAAIGVTLIWRQGFQTLFSIRATPENDEGLGANELFDSACFALAGLLLIIPGFLTDGLAIALLIPRLRRKIWRALTGLDGPLNAPRDPSVIEGEYEVVVEKREIESPPNRE